MTANNEKASLPHVCDTDENWISVAEALRVIKRQIKPIEAVETVAIRDALGRVLAQDVKSPLDVPNHTNSAMDGYALSSASLPKSGNAHLPIVGTSAAGAPFKQTVPANSCCRIFTGAVMPDGTDTVIPQERVTVKQDVIEIDDAQQAGANVRKAGEDLKIGDTALYANTCLSAAHIGVAASLGLSELRVKRKPIVAFFSNGDELRAIGEPLAHGDVYDSNRYTLYSMLTRLGVEIIDLGVVPDDQKQIREVLAQASDAADIVISSAGASVGDLDYITEISQAHGQLFFDKVAIKPGRPVTFARLSNSYFFGLPGNPVSVMVTFLVFVRPALDYLLGLEYTHPISMMVRCTNKLKKSTGRMEYQRATLQFVNDEWIVSTKWGQGSGILSSMANSNCFIELPHDLGQVEADTMVKVIPFVSFSQ